MQTDVVLAHLLAQRCTIQPQHFGSARLVVIAVAQCCFEQRRFNLIEDGVVQLRGFVPVQAAKVVVDAIRYGFAQRLLAEIIVGVFLS